MKFNIAVLPGDGIGPEVIEQSVRVCDAVAKIFNHTIKWNYGLVGASAIEKKGDPYPKETHKICLSPDAILFGAIGDPKFDNDPSLKIRPEQGLLEMRKKLGLFANVRPTFTFPSLINKSPLTSPGTKPSQFKLFKYCEATKGVSSKTSHAELSFKT